MYIKFFFLIQTVFTQQYYRLDVSLTEHLTYNIVV